MIGWSAGIPGLYRYLPGMPAMTTMSALLAVLTGLTLLLLRRSPRRRALLPASLALGVVLLSLQSLAEEFLGWEHHLNEHLQNFIATAPSGLDAHPAPQSVVAFLLLGLSMLLGAARPDPRQWLPQALAITVLVVVLTVLTGYLLAFRPLYMYDADPLRGLSPACILALSLPALGLLHLHPGRGFSALLYSAGPGGLALRRLLPFALILPPLLLVLLEHGVRNGWYSLVAGSALVAMLATLATITLLVWTARHQERMRAGELREAQAEARFRTLFDNLSDAVFIHDLEGHFLATNRAACDSLGYSPEALRKRGLRDIEAPECGPPVSERLAKLRADGQGVFESVHLGRDGRRVPVEIKARLIRHEGHPAVISVARDITQRLEMEAVRRRGESETRALLDAMDESAFLIARDGTLLALNETAAHRLGHERQDLQGKNIFDQFPPEVSAHRRNQLREVLNSGRPGRFSDERQGRRFDIAIYPILGPDAAVERCAIYAKDVTEREQMRALDKLFQDIDRQVLRGTALNDLLEFICAELARLFNLGYVWIGKKQPGGSVEYLAGAGPSEGYREALQRICIRWDLSLEGRGPVGNALRSGEPQTFSASDPGFRPWRQEALRHGLQAVQALPLIVRGEVYGTLALYGNHPFAFSEEGVGRRLASVAQRVCNALESAMDQYELRMLSTALSTAGNGVFITDRNGRIKWANAAFSRMTGYSLSEALGQNPRFLNSAQHSPAYYRQMWETIQAGIPWNGETVERRKDGKLFTVLQTITPIRSSAGEISHYLSILEDITPRKEQEARIQYMAHYDALTGLPNRFLFEDRLGQLVALARRGDNMMAVMFLDLDGFKAVNDRHGHHVGDQLLQGVAERLLDCVRESDTVARLAGDEFTVLLPDVALADEAQTVADKIIAEMGRPFLLDGREVRTSVSIGIALAPRDARDAETLLKLADAAMYQAKQAGAGRWRFHQARTTNG